MLENLKVTDKICIKINASVHYCVAKGQTTCYFYGVYSRASENKVLKLLI